MSEKNVYPFPKQWMGVQEVSTYIGVSKETVYRHLKNQTIPAHRLGKLWKFRRMEIDHWMGLNKGKTYEYK